MLLLLRILNTLFFLNFCKIIGAKLLDVPLDINDELTAHSQKWLLHLQGEDPLWVLKLRDDDTGPLKIRAGTPPEENEFNTIVGPLIERYELRQSTVVKKDAPSIPLIEKSEYEEENKYYSKNEVLKLLNKFVLNLGHITDTHLSTAIDEGPSMTMFFKGPYTSLIVEAAHQQWHTFIAPPSPIPSWFFQDHSNFLTGELPTSLVVPSQVEQDFYKYLVKMLMQMLAHPV